MSQFYTISNAFPAKDKAGEIKSWESQYGTFYVFKYYFQNDDTPYFVNRKSLDGAPQKGDSIYGTVGEDRFGNATFKQEQVPEGVSAPRQAAQTATGGGASVDSKLDYIISLLENRANFPGNVSGTAGGGGSVPTDIDDGPVDLSALDY